MACNITDIFDGLPEGGDFYYTGSTGGCSSNISFILTNNGQEIFSGFTGPSTITPLLTIPDNGGTLDLELVITSAETSGCEFNFGYVLNGGTFNMPTTCGTVHTYTVEILDAPNAGVSNGPYSYCDNDNLNINLNDLIDGEDGGGVWTDAGDNPVIPAFINPSVLGAGTYTYTYTVTQSTTYATPAGCDTCESSVDVVIEVQESLNAGGDNPQAVCE